MSTIPEKLIIQKQSYKIYSYFLAKESGITVYNI